MIAKTSLLIAAVSLLLGRNSGQFTTIDPAEYDKAVMVGIPTVSYCDLIRTPEKYDRKFVRVHATYQNVGGEYTNLVDLSCLSNSTRSDEPEGGTHTWVEFDKSTFDRSPPDVVQSFRKLSWSQHRADVIVVGESYGPSPGVRYGHMGSAKCQLAVARIEKASAIQ